MRRKEFNHGFHLYKFSWQDLHFACQNPYSLYFFARTEKEGALDAVPEGYEVGESKNGLPFLKRAQQ
jgi:hypothetical protein